MAYQLQYHLYPGNIDSRKEQTSEIFHKVKPKLMTDFQHAEWEYSRVWFSNNNDGSSIKPLPETWFVPGSPFAGSSYIGFQGPDLLKTVINNIVQNIDSLEDDFLKKLNYTSKENMSNIHLEVKWLIDNKRRRLEVHNILEDCFI